MQDYLEEQKKPASSPEEMLEVMKSHVQVPVQPRFEVLQKETAKLWTNLLWNMMQPKIDTRLTEKQCRLYPALTNVTFSKAESDAVKGDGLLIPGRIGPKGSPFECVLVPRVEIESWGIGLFAEDLKDGHPACLYIVVALSATSSIDYWPQGRHNVSVFDGDVGSPRLVCLGELPLVMIQELGAPGTYFNSKCKLEIFNFWCVLAGAITASPSSFMEIFMIQRSHSFKWQFCQFFRIWKFLVEIVEISGLKSNSTIIPNPLQTRTE